MNKAEKQSPYIGFLSLKTVIRTKDFDSSKKFYNEVLYLKTIETYNDSNGSRGFIVHLEPNNNNAFIEISEINKNHSYYQKSFDERIKNDKIDIQLRTDNIAYWALMLKDKWTVKGPIKRPWGALYLYLRDPDGIQIIIYQEKVVN